MTEARSPIQRMTPSAAVATSAPAHAPPRPFALDAVNLRLLQLLEEDARASVSRLAREVGLTDNAVRYRLQRLRTSGVLRRITVDVDPARLGRRRAALVLLQLAHGTDLAPLRAYPAFAQVMATRGQFQAAVLVMARDSEDLDRILAEDVRSLPGVQAVLALDVHPGPDLRVSPSACGVAAARA